MLDEEKSQYDYRATSANGLVLAVREIANDPKGELDFWSEAVENTLRYNGGYALLKKDEITTRQGHKGVRLRLGLDNNDKPHEYTVAVFVTDDHVFLVQVGGEKTLLEKNAKTIDAWVNGFVIN